MNNETTKKAAGSVVYCGPSVRGVARQCTVYSGGIPDALEAFVAQHPAVKALIVPVSAFAQMRAALETRRSAEAILYQKVLSELKQGGK